MKREHIDIAPFLRRVEKPGRYIGHEWNLPQKDFEAASVRMVMAFPDLYEVGMSHLGLRILYEAVNRCPDFSMERVMAPGPDLEALLRNSDTPIFSLETNSPVGNFDVVGFSIQYELTATNILNILDLAGIPLRSENRDYTYPIIIAGGPCVYNPEPYAPFFDVVMIGEGEEALPQFLELYQKMRPDTSQKARDEFLKAIAKEPGFYVPCLYEVKNGAVVPKGDAPSRIKKVYIKDLNTVAFPTAPLVPHTEIIHDRGTLELFRGCLRGCRFCQAGMIYRPRREKDVNTLMANAHDILSATGYDELGLLSLSTMDYSKIQELVSALNCEYADKGVSFGLPSLRMNALSVQLAQEVQKVRKGSLTLAPEAGSQRMRDIINKNVTEEDIINTSVLAAKAGYQSLKFYTMVGLPLETQADVEGLTEMLKNVKDAVRCETGMKNLNLTASLGAFVPKSHTPFQWCGQEAEETIIEKQKYLKNWAKTQKGIRVNYHSFDTCYLEAIISRGDRRIADLIEEVFRLGGRLDGWGEYFRYDLWLQAMENTGIDGKYYAMRTFDIDEPLPWDHISPLVTKRFLLEEWEKAQQAAVTPHCYDDVCVGCGAGCRKKGERR